MELILGGSLCSVDSIIWFLRVVNWFFKGFFFCFFIYYFGFLIFMMIILIGHLMHERRCMAILGVTCVNMALVKLGLGHIIV